MPRTTTAIAVAPGNHSDPRAVDLGCVAEFSYQLWAFFDSTEREEARKRRHVRLAAFADMAPATRERLVSGRIRAKMSLLLWSGEKLRVPASWEAQLG